MFLDRCPTKVYMRVVSVLSGMAILASQVGEVVDVSRSVANAVGPKARHSVPASEPLVPEPTPISSDPPKKLIVYRESDLPGSVKYCSDDLECNLEKANPLGFTSFCKNADGMPVTRSNVEFRGRGTCTK